MNATTRAAVRLVLATPLAVGAISFGSGVAHADGFEPNGPILIAQPQDDDPMGPGEIAIPKPDADPKPQGPGDLTNPEKDDDPKPQGPGDLTNPEGDDDPKPEGPGDITNPDGGDEPGPQIPGDKDGPNPVDEDPKDEPEDQPKDTEKEPKGELEETGDVEEVAPVTEVPTRIDAGAGPADEGDGLQLAWVLAGGGLVTAAGATFARRRGTSQR